MDKEEFYGKESHDFYQGKKIGHTQAIKEVLEIIDKQIKIWESDNKGKEERYYGTTGCVVKVLEELKAQIGSAK